MSNAAQPKPAQALATIQPTGIAPARPQVSLAMGPQSLDEAWMLATRLADSDIIPEAFRGKPGNILSAVLMGHDVGFSPMQAMRNIDIIKGRPFMESDAKVGLIWQSGQCEQWDVDGNSERCTITAKRRGKKARTMSLTMADAVKRGLTVDGYGKPKPAWVMTPDRMLEHRVGGWLADSEFPDIVRGFATKGVDDVPSIVDAGSGSTAAVIPTNTQAVAVPEHKAVVAVVQGSSTTSATVGPAAGAAAQAVPPHDPVTGEVVDVAKPDVAPAAETPSPSNPGEAAAPAPDNNAAIDTLISKVKGAASADVVTVLRKEAEAICPKGHPRRDELAQVINTRRAELKGA